MELKLAKSLAGHDKDEIYLVLKETGDCYELVNGKNRTADHPKLKKKKHTQIINRLPDECKAVFSEEPLRDETIKRILKTYTRSNSCRKQM